MQQDVGLWGSLLIFCGLAGATVAGIFIDYTKLFKEIGVVAFTFAIACLIWFVEVSGHGVIVIDNSNSNDYMFQGSSM